MKAYQHGFFGVDKIGRPFYIDNAGSIDVDKLLAAVDKETFTLNVVHLFEDTWKSKYLVCSELFDRQINQSVNIFDCGGFHLGLWSKKSIAMLKITMNVGTDLNPECMGRTFVIKAPFVFTACWSLIKGWLDEKIKKKVVILGHNFINQLLEYIDEDQIPCFLGGTNAAKWTDDYGPWNDYEVVDSAEPGAIVGVRRKGDPDGKVFTPQDQMKLQNPLIKNEGVWGTKGAVIR
jgi:hypothetical protein